MVVHIDGQMVERTGFEPVNTGSAARCIAILPPLRVGGSAGN